MISLRLSEIIKTYGLFFGCLFLLSLFYIYLRVSRDGGSLLQTESDQCLSCICSVSAYELDALSRKYDRLRIWHNDLSEMYEMLWDAKKRKFFVNKFRCLPSSFFFLLVENGYHFFSGLKPLVVAVFPCRSFRDTPSPLLPTVTTVV